MESIPKTERADENREKAGIVKQCWRTRRIDNTGSEGVRGTENSRNNDLSIEDEAYEILIQFRRVLRLTLHRWIFLSISSSKALEGPWVKLII